MERDNSSQLDLFSQSGEFPAARNETKRSFWSCVWGYEKIIFLLIGFIIVGVVAFSTGVEKGKKIALLNNETQAKALTLEQQPQKANITVNAAAPAAQQVQPTATPKTPIAQPAEPTGKYTIQIASFKTRDLAQKEFDLLKNKGYSPTLTTKKGITVVYVGNFTNKTQAKSLLSQLQKRYKDCFIRRL